MKNPSPKRSRGRPKTFQRKEVLDLAMNCYWYEGVKTLSVNEICQRINIAKPTLYREFGGEDGLLCAVIAHYEQEVLGTLLPIVLQAPTLQIGLHELIKVITTPNENPLGCLFVHLQQNKAKLGPQTKAYINKMQHKMQILYQELVSTEQIQGRLRSDIDIQLAAQYIDTQVMTMLSQMSREENVEMVRRQGALALSVLFLQQTST